MNKTAIIGKPASGDLVKSFRSRKMALKAQGYPIKETRALVKELFEIAHSKWEGVIDANTILVKVPSGSGVNKVTVLFAKELAKKFNAQVLPDGLIMRKHRLEAKTNLTLGRRISDPIGYALYSKEIKEAVGNRKVMIVDDLIGSGESSVKLKKTLESNGIAVDAMINLVTVENRYPSVKDIARLVEKVASQRQMTTGEKENFWKDVSVVFGDYTRQKLNRVEREIRSGISAIGAYEVIKKAASIERQFITELKTPSKQKSQQLSI